MTLKAVVVDDERLAAAHLKQMLTSLGIDVVGEAASAADGLALVDDQRPDVVFLDIQMPGMSGMQMADAILQLDAPPMVVFVTGYSEYAVNAFEKDALDYVVKPVSRERLETTLARARARTPSAAKEVAETITRVAASEEPAVRRLPIRDDYAVRLIKMEEIVYAEAREKRVYVHVAKGEFRTYYTLKQLETMLPTTFFRTHDSSIVNLEAVEELYFLGNHAYEIRLSDGSRLPVSRARFGELQRRLGVE